MTDRYEEIRRALAMGPTPGPWAAHPDIGTPVGTLKIAPPIWGTNTFNVPLIAAVYGTGVTQPANAALIAACDPGTIRELLAERDQLAAALEAARKDAERLAFLAREPVIEEINGVKKSIYDYAAMIAEENGRDEPNYEDYTNGMRRLIDAAIDQAMKEQA